MSVPPDRMAPRTTHVGDPDKIMGLPKPLFWIMIALGLLIAYYVFKHSSSATSTTPAQDSNATTNGVTAADIGGTPQDNEFGTITDEEALQAQIQQMQNSINQLQGAPAGSTTGAGVTGVSNPSNPTGQ